ncbi:MAG: hypothetical protein QF744_09440 [SAR202 cluster bacterium]|nr:hypothetical protein [SAR202 cluster bacterium]
MRPRAIPALGRFVALSAVAATVASSFAACSSSVPVSAGAALPAVEAERVVPPAVVKEVFASVLITEADGPTGEIDRLVVSPMVVLADPWETVSLAAEAILENGAADPAVDLIWMLSDIRAGSISSSGEFTAGGTPGVYPAAILVTARNDTSRGIDQITETVSVTIVGETRAASIATIEILPSGPTVFSGQLFRMRAIGYDEDGYVIPGVNFNWTVNDATLGSVTASGYLNVQGSPGMFTKSISVTGRWRGETMVEHINVKVLEARPGAEDMTVQVLPQRFHIDNGDNMQLRAVALNGLGELIPGTQLRWSVDEPIAGSITGTGMFTAGVAPGIYTEAVRVEAIIRGESGVIHAADFASVIVRGESETRRLDRVVGRPGHIVLSPGGRSILVARAFDSEGNSADKVEFRWMMTDEAAGVIDNNGSFRASSRSGVYPSSAKVIATQDVGGEQLIRSASVDVIITGTLTVAGIEPAAPSVSQGESVHFSAVGTDENGTLLPGLVVRWRLADDAIGHIDALGNFTAEGRPGLYENAIVATVIQPFTD